MLSFILEFIQKIQYGERHDYFDLNSADLKIKELRKKGERHLEEDMPTLAKWSFAQADALQEQKDQELCRIQERGSETQKGSYEASLRGIYDYEKNEVWNGQKRFERAQKSVEKSDYFKRNTRVDYQSQFYLAEIRGNFTLMIFLNFFIFLFNALSSLLLIIPLVYLFLAILSGNLMRIILMIMTLIFCIFLSMIFYYVSTRILMPVADEYAFENNNPPDQTYWERKREKGGRL